MNKSWELNLHQSINLVWTQNLKLTNKHMSVGLREKKAFYFVTIYLHTYHSSSCRIFSVLFLQYYLNYFILIQILNFYQLLFTHIFFCIFLFVWRKHLIYWPPMHSLFEQDQVKTGMLFLQLSAYKPAKFKGPKIVFDIQLRGKVEIYNKFNKPNFFYWK